MTTDDRWTGTAEQFVRCLERGAYEEAARSVSPDVPPGAMSAERLALIWPQLTSQLGTLTALTPTGVTEQQGRQVVDLAARFARSEVTLRVVLSARGEVAGFWVTPPRPPAYAAPDYADPDAFTESDVAVGSGRFTLRGTLTLPKGNAPVPVVVLVHGSGPNDRDATIGANRPFRDLAWGLASRGVGTLRYDKRTYAHGAAMKQSGVAVTVDSEVIDDALAALHVARGQPRAAAGGLYLLGHSLGALLAPEIARRDGHLAGIALLAAPARPTIDLVLEQVDYLRGLAPAGGAAQAELDVAATLVAALKAHAVPADSDVLGAPASYWYDLNRHRATDVALTLDLPILVLQGARDYQATTTDFELWTKALAGRPNATLTLYADLNHLFMTGQGKATPAEYTAHTGHVAGEVVADLARWISTRHHR